MEFSRGTAPKSAFYPGGLLSTRPPRVGPLVALARPAWRGLREVTSQKDQLLGLAVVGALQTQAHSGGVGTTPVCLPSSLMAGCPSLPLAGHRAAEQSRAWGPLPPRTFVSIQPTCPPASSRRPSDGEVRGGLLVGAGGRAGPSSWDTALPADLPGVVGLSLCSQGLPGLFWCRCGVAW